MPIKESREDGSQKSDQHISQELHHRHHLLSEGCPKSILVYSVRSFKVSFCHQSFESFKCSFKISVFEMSFCRFYQFFLTRFICTFEYFFNHNAPCNKLTITAFSFNRVLFCLFLLESCLELFDFFETLFFRGHGFGCHADLHLDFYESIFKNIISGKHAKLYRKGAL